MIIARRFDVAGLLNHSPPGDLRVLAWAVFFALAAPAAQAAPSTRHIRFHVPAQSTRAALLELALQADVSLGGAVALCGGASPGVSGQLTLEAALARVLARSNCTFVLADPQTVVIRLVPASPPPVVHGHAAPARPPPAPPAPDTPTVGEVVVVAGRRAALPHSAPYSVTPVPDEQLRRTRTIDLSDLTSEVAGMTVTNLGPGRDKVLLRGMSDGAFTGLTQSTVGLYLDDVPVTYNAPDPDLKLVDVERIEVLRGPQGTLYGGGSLGGIVRIVTYKPNLDDMEGSASGTLSTTHAGGVNDDLEGVLNVPLVPGTAALRVAAYRQRDSGYIDDLTQGRQDVNRNSRDGFRAALRLQVNPDWSIVAGTMHQSIKTADAQYVTGGASQLSRSGQVAEPHDNDVYQLYATVEGHGDWGRLLWSTSWLSHDLESQYDASPGPATPVAFEEAKEIDLLVSELTLASAETGRIRWLLGAFGSVGSTQGSYVLHQLAPVDAVTYREDRTDDVYEIAVFGEASYDLTNRLSMTAGARWFDFRFKTISSVVQGDQERPFTGRSDASGLSPKISLQYRLNDGATLYAQITEGHRAGGFNTGGPIGQDFSGQGGQPAREYLPDTLWNYETGAKLSLFDERLRLRFAAYYADWRDIQSDQFLPSGLPYTVNVGDGVNAGLELEASWRPTANLTLRAAALVNDPHLTSPAPDFAAQQDAPLPGVPKFSASLGASYTRPLPRGVELRLDGQLAYVGESHLLFDSEPRYQMGDYLTGRLTAGVVKGRWEARLFIDNPFDSRANTFAFGDPFLLNRDQVTTPLRPRTVGLQLSTSF